MGFVTPAKRKKVATVKSTWKRLDAVLRELAPIVQKDLNRPSKKRPIYALEKALNYSLPSDVKESLLCHDGQKDDTGGCIFEMRLLSVNAILHEWKNNRVFDFDAVPDKRVSSWPKNKVQLCELHPAWIPLVADWSGNYIGVDLAPDLGGQRGQVIVFGRSESRHYVFADSWGDFLLSYVDDLESGNYEVILNEGEEDVPEFRYYEGYGDTIKAVGTRLGAPKYNA